jgi:hypothetical protein
MSIIDEVRSRIRSIFMKTEPSKTKTDKGDIVIRINQIDKIDFIETIYDSTFGIVLGNNMEVLVKVNNELTYNRNMVNKV